MQNRVFVYPLLLLAAVGCAVVLVVSGLGHLGVTDRPSHRPEFFVSSLGLVIAVLFALGMARMKTECFGPVIWRHYGILHAKRKVLVDLDEVDVAHVYPTWAGPYQMIRLDFLDSDGQLVAVGPSLPNFQHRDQREFHDYLSRYVRVTGKWQLARSNFIQTETHPPPPT